MEQFMDKVASAFDGGSENEVIAEIEKIAADYSLSAEHKEPLVKFAQHAFALSRLDTESLVKKALGQLGDSADSVDSFLAGIDSFIQANNLTKEAGELVKVAVAIDAISGLEAKPEVSAVWFKLNEKLLG